MDQEDNIQKLLRLKRYEQPPPGYFEDFLRDFQLRQRAELIRRPVWSIILDRLTSIAPSFHVPRVAYAAMAAVALVASVGILSRPAGGGNIANSSLHTMSLAPSNPVTIGETMPVGYAPVGEPSVHYVLPNRPVSYAPSRSF